MQPVPSTSSFGANNAISTSRTQAALFNTTDPALKRSFKGHKETINTVVINPNLKQVVSGSADSTVMVWNFKPNMRPFRFVGHKGPVYSVAVSASGQTIISGSEDHTIRIWKNSVEGTSHVVKTHSSTVRTVALSQDASLILSGSNDKTLKVTSLQDRKFLFSINAHNNYVRSAEFSPDTRLIASGSEDMTVKIWDFTSRNIISTLSDHTAPVTSVRFHPDGTCVAACSDDKSIKIWDIRSQRLIQHYDAHKDAVTSIAFHPNGRYLVSGSKDDTVKIWDLRQGHILYSLYGHAGPVQSVNFSPSGDYFTSAGNDMSVMIWKSNLNETELELIDDFGGKNHNVVPGAVPHKVHAPETDRNLIPPPSNFHAKCQSKLVPMTSTDEAADKSGLKGKPFSKHSGKVKTHQYEFPDEGKKGQTESHISFANGKQSSPKASSILQPPSYPKPSQIVEGITGTGDELTTTLKQVVTQLDIITRTLSLLEQRVTMNEESVGNVMGYFKERAEIKQSEKKHVLVYNPANQMQQDLQQDLRFTGLQQLTANMAAARFGGHSDVESEEQDDFRRD